MKQALKHTDIDTHIPLSKSEMKALMKVAVKGQHLYNIYKQSFGHVRTAYGSRRDDTVIFD